MLAALRWWTSRGAHASFERDEHLKLLRTAHQLWGRRVIHVFDQGLSGSPWLGALRHFDARFVLRWNKKFHLLSQDGIKQPPWHFGRGKKGLQERQLFDAVKKQTMAGNVLFFPVTHPDFPGWPLTLVISRRKGGKPWYLLTNEPVETADDAWRVALSSIRRWQIELAIRNVKSELAIASPRVYEWEVRLKLLGLASLAYAFLMELMRVASEAGSGLADRPGLSSHRNPYERGGGPVHTGPNRAVEGVDSCSVPLYAQSGRFQIACGYSS